MSAYGVLDENYMPDYGGAFAVIVQVCVIVFIEWTVPELGGSVCQIDLLSMTYGAADVYPKKLQM